MAANQTTNYQLNQWEATDQVLRTDFNADNAKVDAALAGLAGAVQHIRDGADRCGGDAERVPAPSPFPFPQRRSFYAPSRGRPMGSQASDMYTAVWPWRAAHCSTRRSTRW